MNDTQTQTDPLALADRLGLGEPVAEAGDHDNVPFAPPIETTPYSHLAIEEIIPTKAQKRTGQAKRPASELAKILPPTDRVHVYKRGDDGKNQFINDFDANDLAGSGNIAAFLKRYVVPKWNAGEFHLFYQRSGTAGIHPIGSVTVAEPNQQQSTTAGALAEILELHDKMRQPDKDPIDQMMKLNVLRKELGGDDDHRKAGGGGGDLMGMFMMMNLMNQQKEPPISPVMKLLVDKLERMENQNAMMAQLPPPLPMPPSEKSTDTAALIATMMQGFQQTMTQMLQFMKPEVKQERNVIDEIKVIVELLKPEAKKNGWDAKEIVTFLPQAIGTLKQLGLLKTDDSNNVERVFEQLRLMKMLKDEMMDTESQGNSFWDAAVPILKLLMEKGAGANVEQAIENVQVRQQPPKQIESPKEDNLEIPTSFQTFVDRIVDADTPQKRIGAFVQGLQHLASVSVGWRKVVTKLLTHSKQNEKTAALKILDGILSGFVDLELIEKPIGEEIFLGFQMYWVQICQALGFKTVQVDPAPYVPPAPEKPADEPKPEEPKGENGAKDEEDDGEDELEEEEDDEEEEPEPSTEGSEE